MNMTFDNDSSSITAYTNSLISSIPSSPGDWEPFQPCTGSLLQLHFVWACCRDLVSHLFCIHMGHVTRCSFGHLF